MDFARVAAALGGFHGAERRFERHGEAGGVLVVDDYGHHPTEIAAVMAAARATLDRRLIVAFQPHRHSRTAHLLEAFGPALAGADEIVLTDIYAAGEDPIPNVTLERLADSIRTGSGRPVHVVRALKDVVPELLKIVRPGDAVITLGPGRSARCRRCSCRRSRTRRRRTDAGCCPSGQALPARAGEPERPAVVAAVLVDARAHGGDQPRRRLRHVPGC
jgi:UDP-N-acetylmuramate-alanine ligase